MNTEPETDSLFSSDDGSGASSMKVWSDIRLIHESRHGWCSIYSGIYRDKRVAIKTLKPQYKTSELHQRMLRKEFAIASGMNHQNIAAALWMEDVPDIGEGILMEYVDGITLAEYIDRNPTISYKQTEQIIRQLCAAVNYIHSRQTFHCDLKPSNIMITSSSSFVKLIDFGMSRGSGFETLDFAGGTKGFTAPENFLSNSEASPAVDIYSIGKILELIDKKGEMKKVWKKCLSTDPHNRPRSASEIPELLRQHHNRRGRRRILVAIMGMAILCGGLFWPWYHFQRPNINGTAIPANEPTQPSPPPVSRDSVSYATGNPAGNYQNQYLPDAGFIPSAETFGNTLETEDERPIKTQLSEKFEQVAARRFNDHLNLIDTMTTARSNKLQGIGYWRWLAKQDMKIWLEEKLAPDNRQIDEVMKNMDGWINFYASFQFRKAAEATHRREAAKRCPDLNRHTTRYDYDGDMLVIRKLGKDSTWHEERIQIPLNRLNDE